MVPLSQLHPPTHSLPLRGPPPAEQEGARARVPVTSTPPTGFLDPEALSGAGWASLAWEVTKSAASYQGSLVTAQVELADASSGASRAARPSKASVWH